MSTPIKPPGGPSSSAVHGENGTSHGRVEGRSGELRSMVENAQAEAQGAGAAQGAEPTSLGGIEQDLKAGRIDVEQAIDRLVERALASAAGLPAEQRAMIEVNLRNALAEDPTLIALQKDLERGSST